MNIFLISVGITVLNEHRTFFYDKYCGSGNATNLRYVLPGAFSSIE